MQKKSIPSNNVVFDENVQKKFIGFDVRTFNLAGGSRVYGQNLLNYFPSQNLYLFGVSQYKDYPHCYPTKISASSPLRLVYENFILPKILKDKNISLFHGLKGVAPIFGNFKKVITVHDLIAFEFPQSMRLKDVIFWRYFFPLYLKSADHVICISEYTKIDLMKRFKLPEHKISVIYHGFDPKQFTVMSREKSFNNLSHLFQMKGLQVTEKKQFLLNVNTISPRKNISRLIKSFELAKKDNPFLHLLIVGKKGWKYDLILKTYDQSPYKEDITFLDYVTDDELAALYNISFAFIYPSTYEGFGLPILEAQSCRTPVITSNLSCLPEIAEDSAFLVNPYDIQDVASAINQLASDVSMQEKYIQKGLKNIQRFSWEKCAQETADLYSQLLSN